MGWLQTAISFIANLLGLSNDAQKAQNDKNQRDIGQKLQAAGDLTGSLDAEKKMGSALADQPKDQAELDARLNTGDF